MHETGKRGLTRDAAIRYSLLLGVSVDYLLLGQLHSQDISLISHRNTEQSTQRNVLRGENGVDRVATRGDTDLSLRRELPPSHATARDLPLIDVAPDHDGTGDMVMKDGTTVDLVRRPPGLVGDRNAFAVYMQNDSMSPRFERGDLVYVSKVKPAAVGGDVLVELQSGTALIKRLAGLDKATLTLREYSPKLRDFTVKRKDVKQLLRVFSNAELLGS